MKGAQQSEILRINETFLNGLVFGFDVGTGSIGYAVRRGKQFVDVGVLICPEETSNLEQRRGYRRQRRTLRSKRYRRQWLRAELEKLGLGSPKAGAVYDPVALRVRAVTGDQTLTAEQLHAAVFHLWKRRGYEEDVPWKNQELRAATSKEEEWGNGTLPPHQVQLDLDKSGFEFPCQFLASQTVQRKRVWPRTLLEKEFRAMAAHYPKLAEKVDWLLYGDTQQVNNQHVYFKSTEGRNPGVLGLRWPRFDNRGPALARIIHESGENRLS